VVNRWNNQEKEKEDTMEAERLRLRLRLDCERASQRASDGRHDKRRKRITNATLGQLWVAERAASGAGTALSVLYSTAPAQAALCTVLPQYLLPVSTPITALFSGTDRFTTVTKRTFWIQKSLKVVDCLPVYEPHTACWNYNNRNCEARFRRPNHRNTYLL